MAFLSIGKCLSGKARCGHRESPTSARAKRVAYPQMLRNEASMVWVGLRFQIELVCNRSQLGRRARRFRSYRVT